MIFVYLRFQFTLTSSDHAYCSTHTHNRGPPNATKEEAHLIVVSYIVLNVLFTFFFWLVLNCSPLFYYNSSLRDITQCFLCVVCFFSLEFDCLFEPHSTHSRIKFEHFLHTTFLVSLCCADDSSFFRFRTRNVCELHSIYVCIQIE